MAAKQVLHNDVVPQQWVGQPLLQFLKNHLQLSNRQIQQVVRTRGLYVDGRRAHTKAALTQGQRVKVLLPRNEPLRLEPIGMDLDVLWQDQHILAVSKPTGLAVHPTGQAQEPTLAAGVAQYLAADQGRTIVPRPVHRLDKEASGIVVFALNSRVQTELTKVWHTACVHKEYWALVHGRLDGARMFDQPLRGKTARTDVVSEVYYKEFTIVKAVIFTGRTHQIRRHLAAAGYPIVGDDRYGAGSTAQAHVAKRLALHGQRLKLRCPALALDITLAAEPPPLRDIFLEEA